MADTRSIGSNSLLGTVNALAVLLVGEEPKWSGSENPLVIAAPNINEIAPFGVLVEWFEKH